MPRPLRVAAGLLAILLLPGYAAASCIMDPCLCHAELYAPVAPVPLLACPAGDTPAFIDQGFWLSITALSCDGVPVPYIPAADIWLIDVDPVNDLSLCGGSRSADADSATGSSGTTTMSTTTLVAGGCADGLAVIIQGFVIVDPSDCYTYKAYPIHVRTPDLDGSLLIDMVDLAVFAMHFPPQAYESCCDFDVDGDVDIVDLATFAQHFGPPGHSCN